MNLEEVHKFSLIYDSSDSFRVLQNAEILTISHSVCRVLSALSRNQFQTRPVLPKGWEEWSCSYEIRFILSI